MQTQITKKASGLHQDETVHFDGSDTAQKKKSKSNKKQSKALDLEAEEV